MAALVEYKEDPVNHKKKLFLIIRVKKCELLSNKGRDKTD